jgi:predicted dehydrogenase
VRQWLAQGRIGEVRHLSWTLTKAPSAADLDGSANWRTDPSVAGGGYFADLASHGFDLFQYLVGDIVEVAGFTARQAGLYAAEDAVSASWRFASGALGMGCWSFVADRREDRVEIIGNQGRIAFSVFDEHPVQLFADEQISLEIPHHEHIQWHHVLGMNAHIRGDSQHPAVAEQAVKTDWVMDQILKR